MKLFSIHITKKEWFWITALSFLLIIITTAPYLYAHFTLQPHNTFFTGTHTLTPGDYPVYFSYITQVKQGRFPLVNVFSAETDASFPFPVFWYIVGIFARIFHLTPPLAFHLFRIICIPIFIFLTYPLIAFFFKKQYERLIALLVFIFGSGFGVLAAPFITPFADNTSAHWPMDLWVPEAFTFPTLYHSPHLIISLLAILWSIVLSYHALKTINLKYTLGAGIITAPLLFFHPFHAPTIAITLLISFIITTTQNKNYLRRILLTTIITITTIPSLAYHWLFLHTHQNAQLLSSQNILLTPAFHITIISYGLLLFGFLFGSFLIISKRYEGDTKKYFLIAWGIVHLALIYSPLDWQRRLTAGLQFPLAILTTVTLLFIYQKSQPHLTSAFRAGAFWFITSIVAVFVFSLSNIHGIAADIQDWRTKPEKYFIPTATKTALTWSADHTEPNKIFFANIQNTQLIASYTARQVYVGHGVQTPDFEKRFRTLQFFWYAATSPIKKMEMLNDLPIDYLFATGTDRSTIDIIQRLFPLQIIPVFENTTTTIYQFRKTGAK